MSLAQNNLRTLTKEKLRNKIIDIIFHKDSYNATSSLFHKKMKVLIESINQFLNTNSEKNKLIKDLMTPLKFNRILNLSNCDNDMKKFFQHESKPCAKYMHETFKKAVSRKLTSTLSKTSSNLQRLQTTLKTLDKKLRSKIQESFFTKVNNAIKNNNKKVILGPIEYLQPFLKSPNYIVLCMQDDDWNLWQNFRFILCKRKPGESIYMLLPKDLFHKRITFLEILFLIMNPNQIMTPNKQKISKIQITNKSPNKKIKEIEMCKSIKKTEIDESLLLLEFKY